jgi:hypothetical protein
VDAKVSETDRYWQFSGTIKAFRQLSADIQHQRTVRKYKNAAHWEVTDKVSGTFQEAVVQHWHPAPEHLEHLQMSATDEEGQVLEMIRRPAWYASVYGLKTLSPCLSFSTSGRTIITTIKLT